MGGVVVAYVILESAQVLQVLTLDCAECCGTFEQLTETFEVLVSYLMNILK